VQEPDPRTLARARQGDLAAFEELVRTYQAEVFRFARHLTPDRTAAEDVTQEAFLRAFRFISGYRGETRFSSWLFRIARNCAIDALRKQHYPIVDQDARPERAGAIANAVVRAELDAALATLGAEHRETFLLVEVLGLSHREVADVLGVRVGTVKSRMFRARQALCRALDDEEAAR
jgi:RNA polymerase sigma-70 factor (ECF subfamily)